MPKRPTHLILPDVHCHPKFDNVRLRAVGHYCADVRPDVLVCLGDFADMPSLARQEKGKLSFEGRRYKDDVEATRDGMRELLKPIRNEMAKSRRAAWRPRLVMLLGNHEFRITRTADEVSELAGTLRVDDLGYAEAGWEVFPFREPVRLDSITYAHYFVSGLMGKAIGGENIAKTMCNKLHASCVQGHSHLFDHSERAHISGTKIFGLSAGCYVHPEYREDWNYATVAMWWRGVVLIEDIDGAGYYDRLTTTTQRKLVRDYL